MSLSVSVMVLDPTTRKLRVDATWSAGFERWRRSVYASPLVARLGLELLPALATGHLDVEGPDLARLRREVLLLMQHAHQLEGADQQVRQRLPDGSEQHVTVGPSGVVDEALGEAVRRRLGHVLEAIERASLLGARVHLG